MTGVRGGAAERTIKEFKRYAAERAPQFSESQLDALATGVDSDGDGKISDKEFSGRIEVFRRISRGDSPANKVGDRSKAAAKLVVVPPEVDADAYPILLITADKIAAAWKPYATWKTRSYTVARADQQGSAALRIAPKTAGELIITVSGANLNTVSTTSRVTVQ